MNVQEMSREAIKFGPCDKCGAKRRKVCGSSAGSPYNHGVVHAVRRDAYLAAHPEVLEEARAAIHQAEAQILDSQAAVNEYLRTNDLGLVTVDEYKSLRARDDRVKMVRGVFTMLSNLYGPTQTLDMLAALFVEYDIDETVLWQSNRDPSA